MWCCMREYGIYKPKETTYIFLLKAAGNLRAAQNKIRADKVSFSLKQWDDTT